MTEPHFVIAKYKEDTRWAEKLSHTLVVKDRDLPNHGREISSFLYFIVNNYHKLEGDYVFCQGNPFDHAPLLLEQIKDKKYFGPEVTCDPEGCPNHCGLPIHEISKELGIKPRKKYKFRAGGQFRLSAEEIRERPLSWYVGAFGVSIGSDSAPWVFERLWPLVYPSLQKS